MARPLTSVPRFVSEAVTTSLAVCSGVGRGDYERHVGASIGFSMCVR